MQYTKEPLAHSVGHSLAEQAVAHVRGADIQPLDEHLRGVARLSAKFAAKFQLAEYGELIGLVHDLGKYSAEFQAYIRAWIETVGHPCKSAQQFESPGINAGRGLKRF